MHCLRCGCDSYCKAGFTKGKQRYKCRECGYHFTNTHGRGAIRQRYSCTRYACIRRIGASDPWGGFWACILPPWCIGYAREASNLWSVSVRVCPRNWMPWTSLRSTRCGIIPKKRAQAVDMDCCISTHPAHPRHGNWFAWGQAA